MRQFLIAGFITLISMGVQAQTAIQNSILLEARAIRSESSFTKKMARVSNIRTQIHQEVLKINLPENFLSLPDDHPVLEEFRSLNELEGYFDMILAQLKSKSQCKEVNLNLSESNLIGDESATITTQLPELALSQEVVKALCQ